jgi:hypothetical protein
MRKQLENYKIKRPGRLAFLFWIARHFVSKEAFLRAHSHSGGQLSRASGQSFECLVTNGCFGGDAATA